MRLNAEVVGGGGEGRLEHWLPPELERDDSGFVLAGSDVSLEGRTDTGSPRHLETSMPGVFAVGDVRHRSVMRVASAVGEGSVAIQQVHEYLAAERLGGHVGSSRAFAPSDGGGAQGRW